MTWADVSLSELPFPHVLNDVITLLSFKVHSSMCYESTSECLLPKTCTKTTLAPSGGYGNVSQCETELLCGTSQAHRFTWMAGLQRPFANLTEWGQRFMATPNPLEMLGDFLLVLTPNKKQFPLFKRYFLSLFWKFSGFGFTFSFCFSN